MLYIFGFFSDSESGHWCDLSTRTPTPSPLSRLPSSSADCLPEKSRMWVMQPHYRLWLIFVLAFVFRTISLFEASKSTRCFSVTIAIRNELMINWTLWSVLVLLFTKNSDHQWLSLFYSYAFVGRSAHAFTSRASSATTTLTPSFQKSTPRFSNASRDHLLTIH